MIEQYMIDDIKASISLIGMAERRTTLRRESAKEMAGPCPLCGGNDRFHCTTEWFFCRQCHPERGDVIEFVQWVERVGFAEAFSILTGRAQMAPAPIRTPSRKPAQRTVTPAEWKEKSSRIINNAQSAIFTDDGRAGLDYLKSRGLTPATIKAFGLGYRADVALPGTWDEERRQRSYPKQPAIAIPWIVAGQLRAIRYRFLTAHTYRVSDSDSKERTEKQSAEHGSNFAGTLYGGHLLPRCAEDLRTIVLCEGEINAMSIWQMAHTTDVDVLSFGSERQHITPAMVEHIQRYGKVIIWADDRDKATGAMAALLPAIGHDDSRLRGTSSPQGRDANDLLRAGILGGFLAALRREMCKTAQERQSLYWKLWEARHDPATEKVMKQLTINHRAP